MRVLGVDLSTLQATIEAGFRDLRALLKSSPEGAKKALHSLLGNTRLKVRPDEEKGFVVCGEALLCCGRAEDPACTPRSIRLWVAMAA